MNQSNKRLRYIGSLLLIILGIALGFFRYDHVINFTDPSQPFFALRKVYHSLSGYPTSLSQLTNTLIYDPRWISAFLYSLIPLLLAILIIWLIFQKKSYIKITFYTYLALNLLLLVFITLSLIIKDYSIGYGMAQNIKALVQSSFLTIVLIAVFRYYEEVVKK